MNQTFMNQTILIKNWLIVCCFMVIFMIDPEKFKDLYITAVNKGTGELEIFNADNTPDIEIALACRASPPYQ